MQSPLIPIAVSILLALIPVIVWVKILFGKKLDFEKRGSYVRIFIGGVFSVVPIFLLQMFWQRVPALDPFAYIDAYILNRTEAFLVTFVVVGIMEEIVKHMVVRITDRRHPEYIQTINDALYLSIVSALGFAFAENIFYFTNIWTNYGWQELVSAFIFRSIFTAAGHMIFSGIFGYHFGVAKFAADITEERRLSGESMGISRFVARVMGEKTKTYEVFRERTIIEGLLYAMGLHAVFNFLLQLEFVAPVIVLVTLSGAYLYYLMKRKTGSLLFSFSRSRSSSMPPKDEQVVIELLGMWAQQGRYNEVIQICERLLARDPDNNVVKLFREKARDNIKLRTFYESLKGAFSDVKLAPTLDGKAPILSAPEEKVVTEVMSDWYAKGDYAKVLEVANRLLARNPKSEGAALIRQKAYDKTKMKRVWDSLSLIFSEEGS